MITLFEDQQKVFDASRAAIATHQSVMIQAPTGFGKTIVGAAVVRSALAKQKRVYFSVHRKNLVRQTSGSFQQFGIPHGFITAGRIYDHRELIAVAGIDTLHRRLQKYPAPDLFIIDEAHMAAAKTWRKAADYYRDRGTKILGLSATPQRHDGTPLNDIFDYMVLGPSLSWLIDNKRLSGYKMYCPSALDMKGVHSRGGEYVTSEVEDRLDGAKVLRDAPKWWKKYADGKRTICFASSIKKSKEAVEEFIKAGIPAAHLDGTMDRFEQQRVINALADGEIFIVSNCALMDTGFDLSAQVGRDVPIEAMIDLQPTKSLPKQLQKWGRCLRFKLYAAIIIDLVGNCIGFGGEVNHGFPDDEREWSLDGREKRASTAEPLVPMRQCPECFHVHRPAPKCPACDHEYETMGREIEEVDGELIEVSREQLQKEQEAKRQKAEAINGARTAAELAEVAIKHGHKANYVLSLMRTRKDGWYVKTQEGKRLSKDHKEIMNDLVQIAAAYGYKPGWAHFQYRQIVGSER